MIDLEAATDGALGRTVEHAIFGPELDDGRAPTLGEMSDAIQHPFDLKAGRLIEFPSPSLEERKTFLRRMKVLIVEIDMLILSRLKQDSLNTTVSTPPSQPTAESFAPFFSC